ncbi:MAG: hypothetical protein JRN26_02970 [Nitrososphaerota archaeon]|nr:hypothetical protein [Nitrososphaerota archaeon]MDG6931301.1 hypothetical protein [Nitrososphaerota archaeon]MDG6931775.1 hypothetical protein [Nitrososphaerota archaeon]MDG6935836.1 hypothetical protein [Nitrososphaerota archaeon]MDG6944603.1 hypothetical protein [Nitrososphaerota archaeon]
MKTKKIALQTYRKFYSNYEALPSGESIVPELIKGIINDEIEHSKLIQMIVKRY